jgi:serine/threonine protein kinase
VFFRINLRLKAGTRIGNYRIGRQLGRGFEGQVYGAREIGTGVQRAIKIYPSTAYLPVGDLVLRARLMDRLAATGAVVRYHHMGSAILGRGAPVVYHVLESIQGADLLAYLRRITGPKQRRTARALALMLGIAGLLARVHRKGLALGDFETGENIMVLRNGQPIFCDANFGMAGRPNRDFGNDLEEFKTACLLIMRRTRTRHLKRVVMPVLNRYLRLRPRRDLMRRVLRELEEHCAGMSGKSVRHRVASVR